MEFDLLFFSLQTNIKKIRDCSIVAPFIFYQSVSQRDGKKKCTRSIHSFCVRSHIERIFISGLSSSRSLCFEQKAAERVHVKKLTRYKGV